MTDAISMEDKIMRVWTLVEDLETLTKYVGDDPYFDGMDAHKQDRLLNVLIGVRELADMRMQDLWEDFEGFIGDYYKYKRIVEALEKDNEEESKD